jgi:hypothetical protein
MGISLIQIAFLIFMGWVLAGCGGSGGGSSSESLNQPALPTPPVSRIELGDDFVGFIIGSQPLSTDRSSSNSLKFTQQLYELDADNNIAPVPMFDLTDTLIDFTGNLSYTDIENVIPLDVMVLSPDYLLLTVYHRNFDLDEDNDYFNLLIDLHDGSVTAAPVGLNPQGNSGRSSLTQAGRDVFPPDSRWNATNNLYVVSVDYDELGLMQSVDYEPDDGPEIVDHYNDVPCPVGGHNEEPTDESVDDEVTPSETATDDTATDDAAADPDNEAEPTPTGPTCTETSATTEDTTSEEISTEAPTATETADTTANSFSQQISSRALADEPPIPTAIYRMDLYAGNRYSLEKVSAVDDRPGLGQIVINNNGVIAYRNDDGGDNSIRVLLPDCETETGRLSTVLLAPYTTLILAPDRNNISSIFEVTDSGMNKLIFSCNGNVERQAYTGYSTKVRALKLPFNSQSIATYDYAYPYFINTSCQSADLFPAQPGFTNILDPMPILPGVPLDDVRGLRKSQFFNNRLYCIGYDASLSLAIAELNPADRYPQYDFLAFDFSAWLPDFNTLHVLSNGNALFTGTSRVSPEIRTIMVDTSGVETDLGTDLGGFTVGQQIEIIPPGLEYTLPALTETEEETETANQTP